MTWYLVKLCFKIKTTKTGISQFDEQYRLIQATDDMQALLKARHAGVRAEDHIVGETTCGATWEFIDVTHLEPLADFTDGMELCSRIHETEEGESHLSFIRMRARDLETRISPVQQSIA